MSRAGKAHRQRRRRCGFVFLVLLLGFALSAPFAAGQSQRRVHLLLSDSSSHYQRVANAIRERLSNSDSNLDLSLSRVGAAALPPNHDTLLVTIGTKAARWAARERPQQPTLNLFLTRSAWGEIKNTADERHRAVVFLDNPPERLLHLGRILMPEGKVVGTVYGPVSQIYRQPLRQAAHSSTIELAEVTLDPSQNPVAALTPAMERSDYFLALPDQAFFNRNVAKWLLYLGFRYRVPVIGFSESYAKAGAMASLYSTAEDIGRQGAEMIADYWRAPDDFIWGSREPAYFNVEYNPSVARALEISLPPVTTVYRQLKRQPLGADSP